MTDLAKVGARALSTKIASKTTADFLWAGGIAVGVAAVLRSLQNRGVVGVTIGGKTIKINQGLLVVSLGTYFVLGKKSLWAKRAAYGLFAASVLSMLLDATDNATVKSEGKKEAEKAVPKKTKGSDETSPEADS